MVLKADDMIISSGGGGEKGMAKYDPAVVVQTLDSALHRGQNIYLFMPSSFLSRVLWCCINFYRLWCWRITRQSEVKTTDLVAAMVAGIFPRLVSATRVFFVFWLVFSSLLLLWLARLTFPCVRLYSFSVVCLFVCFRGDVVAKADHTEQILYSEIGESIIVRLYCTFCLHYYGP